MQFDIEMLPARNGDALWIEYGDGFDKHRVLIDAGRTETASLLAGRMASGHRPHFDLFVLTHIDADHIEGILPLLEQPGFDATFDDVWFNGWEQIRPFLSVGQGEKFSRLLLAKQLPWNRAFTRPNSATPGSVVMPDTGPLPEVTLAGGMRLTLLSPTQADLRRLAVKWREQRLELRRKGLLGRRRPPPVANVADLDLEALAARKLQRDQSAPNGSSIAFLAEYEGRSAIFTGDAHVDVLVRSIRRLLRQRGGEQQRLRVDAFKLSHHGSAHAMSKALLDLVDCRRYLVSTDGSSHCHPDREAIARVVLWGGRDSILYFNFRSEFNIYWGDASLQAAYGVRAEFPLDDDDGIRMKLFDETAG